jgi:NitT/TauT family transport system ATP-binding protein
VPVTLPRPRRVRELQRDPAFLKLYSEVWEQLERGIQLSRAEVEGAAA